MKRFAVIALVCALLMCATLFPTESVRAEESVFPTVSAETLKKNLAELYKAVPERPSYRTKEDEENNFYEFLSVRYADYVAGGKLSMQRHPYSFEMTQASNSLLGVPQTITVYSDNVIFNIKGKVEDKTLIIGTFYDNADNKKPTGALYSGSGISVCMSLIEHIMQNDIIPAYNLKVIFFGSGLKSYRGSYEYLNKYGAKDVEAFINVYRIGGGETYFYGGETSSAWERMFLDKNASLKKMPPNVPVIDAEYIAGMPYAHYGMIGNHAYYIERGIVVGNIWGAYYDPFFMGDYDGKEKIYSEDTIEKMESAYPDAYDKQAATVNLLLDVMTDGEADIAAAIADARSADDKAQIFYKGWVAYIILGVLLIAIIVALCFTVKHFEKKYPIPVRKFKIAVFGAEYETKEKDTVFVEIKPKDDSDKNDPFGGI